LAPPYRNGQSLLIPKPLRRLSVLLPLLFFPFFFNTSHNLGSFPYTFFFCGPSVACSEFCHPLPQSPAFPEASSPLAIQFCCRLVLDSHFVLVFLFRPLYFFFFSFFPFPPSDEPSLPQEEAPPPPPPPPPHPQHLQRLFKCVHMEPSLLVRSPLLFPTPKREGLFPHSTGKVIMLGVFGLVAGDLPLFSFK